MIELNQKRPVWKTLCVILRKYGLAIENLCFIQVLSKEKKKKNQKCRTHPASFLLFLPLLVYCRYWDPHNLLPAVLSNDNTNDCSCCNVTFCVYVIEFHLRKMLGWYCSALPGYPRFSGLQENQKGDSLVCDYALDFTVRQNYLVLGMPVVPEDCVWNTQKLQFQLGQHFTPAAATLGSLVRIAEFLILNKKPTSNPGVPEFHPAKWLPQIFYQYHLELLTLRN